MNILFIANCTTLYGANRSMLELAEELMRRKNKIFFLFPGEGEAVRYVRQHRYRYIIFAYELSVQNIAEKSILKSIRMLFHNLRMLKKLENVLRQWKIDVIHTNSVTLDIGMLLSLQTKIPHIWHVREMLDDDYGLDFNFKIMQKYLLHKSNKIVYISKAVKKKYNDYYQGQGIIIPDPIDCAKYIQTKNEYFDGAVLNLLLCGVLVEGKGHIDAIKAVNYIIKKKKKTVHLQIVGDGPAAYAGKLEQYVKKLHLEDVIGFLPFQEDLSKIRRNSDVALICSKNEALGRVTIESMLSGLLVIGTYSGATPELLGYGERGELYPAGDYIELAKKILYVMEHKEEEKLKINQAKQYAERTFDRKRRTEEILAIYQETSECR